jgi:hypothetical protein
MGKSTDVKAKFISDTTAADADGLITSTTPGAGGSITLNGAQVSGGVASFGDNTARLITVTSGSDINTRVFTITGTDGNGDAQTDTITGVNANTVASTKYFLTVTDVSVDDATGAAITVGMSDSALGVIFAGRTRIRGLQLSSGGSTSNVSFRNTSASGSELLKFRTVGTANGDQTFNIPSDGVLFSGGAYCAYTIGDFNSITVFYDG